MGRGCYEWHCKGSLRAKSSKILQAHRLYQAVLAYCETLLIPEVVPLDTWVNVTN